MRGNNTYIYNLLKNLDLPKHVVELAVQALQVSPHRVDKASQKGRQEDSGKDILVRPAYELQKTPFNKSGQGMSVNGAHNGVVRLAYNMVKMDVMWRLSTAASDDMNKGERRIALGMGMVMLGYGAGVRFKGSPEGGRQ